MRLHVVGQHDNSRKIVQGMDELRTSRFAKEIPEGWSIFCIARKAASKPNDGDRIRVICARVASLGTQKMRHDQVRPDERLRKI